MKKYQIQNELSNVYYDFSHPKIRYVLKKLDGSIHDKSCHLLKQLSDNDTLEYFFEYQADRNKCKYCCKRAYIRQGALDYKDINTYQKLYEQMKAKEQDLYKLYILYKAQTEVLVGRIKIKVNEDRWILKTTSAKGRVRLLHNSYKRNGDTRIIGGGYHEQCNRDISFFYAVDVITGYSWVNHIVKTEKTEEECIVDKKEYNDFNELKQYGVHVETVPNAGHLMTRENPEGLAIAISQCLKTQHVSL